MTMGATQAGAFTRSSPGVGRPDLQILIQPLSLPKFPGKTDPFAAFTVLGCILRPKSRGSVTVRARDIYTAPAIETNVFAEHQDAVVGANALKIIHKVVLDTSAFAAYAPREHFPGRAIQADEDFITGSYRSASTIYHGVGTCKMGRDHMAVVDERRIYALGLMLNEMFTGTVPHGTNYRTIRRAIYPSLRRSARCCTSVPPS
jgi:choline dehydrogenase